MNRRTLLGYGVGLSLLTGCAAPFEADGSDESAGSELDSPLPAPPADAPLGYTHLRPDGNRRVGGQGSLSGAEPVDIALAATPEWVVGVPFEGDVLFAVVTGAGVEAVRVGDEVTTADIDFGFDGERPPGPPLLVGGSDPTLAPALGSPTTHPVPTRGGWASVSSRGIVRLPGGENADVEAIPDARLVSAGGRLYVFASRTTEYPHGVLGDDVEATTVVALDPAGGVEERFEAPSGVIEGIAPIVADVDDDGEREVVVTTSDAEEGARVLALSEAGGALAGPPIGSGFRWRHQLAVAPFGPDGETELAAVKTPHIGGTAEFYRAHDGELELVTSLRGYSTHSIGSRNLDNAVAGDLDGDGQVELLVPDDPQRNLAGLRREGEGVEEAWRLSLDGRLTTNLCAVSGTDGVVLAAGVGETLRVWPA